MRIREAQGPGVPGQREVPTAGIHLPGAVQAVQAHQAGAEAVIQGMRLPPEDGAPVTAEAVPTLTI